MKKPRTQCELLGFWPSRMGRQTLHRFPFCLTTPLLDFGDYERRRFQHGLALIRLITRLMSVPYLAVLQGLTNYPFAAPQLA